MSCGPLGQDLANPRMRAPVRISGRPLLHPCVRGALLTCSLETFGLQPAGVNAEMFVGTSLKSQAGIARRELPGSAA